MEKLPRTGKKVVLFFAWRDKSGGREGGRGEREKREEEGGEEEGLRSANLLMPSSEVVVDQEEVFEVWVRMGSCSGEQTTLDRI